MQENDLPVQPPSLSPKIPTDLVHLQQNARHAVVVAVVLLFDAVWPKFDQVIATHLLEVRGSAFPDGATIDKVLSLLILILVNWQTTERQTFARL